VNLHDMTPSVEQPHEPSVENYDCLHIPHDLIAQCVDDATFLSIMGAFPSGVTVVTTLDEDDLPCGLTCSATCSLSKTPPMLLICIHNHSRVLKAILRRQQFAVNFLRDNTESTSSLFASQQDDRFRSVVWQSSRLNGLPWMPLDTIAYAECRMVGAIKAGDHMVVIGAIVDGQALGDTVSPLMYWRRRYGRWPLDEDIVTAGLTVATEG
jgi:flavin reductase (NADH)